MNKISMDALDRGWSIGFGTRVYTQNPDFDYARERADLHGVAALEPRRTNRVLAYLAGAEALIALLARRLAY